VPGTYLWATKDTLVRKIAVYDFNKTSENLTIKQLEDRHFIAQRKPK
tara:strand:+ start:294 stop:434 length:141 start_codon:yes stop_codon:yes gene_type:complete